MRELAIAPFGDVGHAPDGAPFLVERDGHISISHDGEHTVAAFADAPCGVDLCLRIHAERTRAILTWLHIRCAADPVAQFAALEAALKLRRLGIERVLARDIEIVQDGRDLVVRGLGEPIRVVVHDDHPDFVVAVCG